MVTYISIHIPKTAGTTLGYLLDYGSNRRIFWDYSPDYTNVEKCDDPLFLKSIQFVDTHFEVIHGHFYYTKYQTLFPNARFITCMRHPVQRVISQFIHILGEKNQNDWFYKAIHNGEMDIVDFASNYSIGNAQTLHLRGRDLKDYDFVFISEHFGESFRIFESKFKFYRNDDYASVGAFPVLNSKKKREMNIYFDNDVLAEIYNKTYDDNELYKEAVYIFNKQMASC